MLFNGQQLAKNAEQLVFDRGLHYGDGFFSTLLVINSKLANWQAHWTRLKESAAAFDFEPLDEMLLKANLKQLIANFKVDFKADSTRLMVKIIISRGKGGKGYQPPKHGEGFSPNLYCFVRELNNQQNNFIKAGISEIEWGIQPLLAGIKHLNRLENVLAQQAMEESLFDECIMFDINKRAISGTQSSLYIVHNGVVKTPIIDTAGIKSTSVNLIESCLQDRNIPLLKSTLLLADIEQAEEIFFCNAIRGIMPVKIFNASNKKIGFSSQLAQDFNQKQLSQLETL